MSMSGVWLEVMLGPLWPPYLTGIVYTSYKTHTTVGYHILIYIILLGPLHHPGEGVDSNLGKTWSWKTGWYISISGVWFEVKLGPLWFVKHIKHVTWTFQDSCVSWIAYSYIMYHAPWTTSEHRRGWMFQAWLENPGWLLSTFEVWMEVTTSIIWSPIPLGHDTCIFQDSYNIMIVYYNHLWTTTPPCMRCRFPLSFWLWRP